MVRNAIENNFRSSKMPGGGNFGKKINNKLVHWSEMARNAIESDFRSSKIAAGGHFVNKIKIKMGIYLKWREMRSKVIFGHPKWPPVAILWIKKVAYWSEMARNGDYVCISKCYCVAFLHTNKCFIRNSRAGITRNSCSDHWLAQFNLINMRKCGEIIISIFTTILGGYCAFRFKSLFMCYTYQCSHFI